MITGAIDRRIDRLLDLLVENATVVVSGGRMADHIGVARSTIWRWVEKLRAMGVDIRGHTGAGYQLKKLPDILLPSLVRKHFRAEQIGHRVVHYFRTESTNSDAMRLAGEGEPHGTVVLAEEQTAGRGRFGRSWYSERSSGIYLSVILRPPLTPSHAPMLSLMAGLAVREAIHSATGLQADIRWPNDLLFGKKKVCGILTEMSAEVDRLHYVIVGIGINVNHRKIPSELTRIATSLRLQGQREYSRLAILIALLRALEQYYRLLLAEGPGAVAERWGAASSFASGKRIRVKIPSEEFKATTLSLEPTGALRVRRDDGTEESLLSAEIIEVK